MILRHVKSPCISTIFQFFNRDRLTLAIAHTSHFNRAHYWLWLILKKLINTNRRAKLPSPNPDHNLPPRIAPKLPDEKCLFLSWPQGPCFETISAPTHGLRQIAEEEWQRAMLRHRIDFFVAMINNIPLDAVAKVLFRHYQTFFQHQQIVSGIYDYQRNKRFCNVIGRIVFRAAPRNVLIIFLLQF